MTFQRLYEVAGWDLNIGQSSPRKIRLQSRTSEPELWTLGLLQHLVYTTVTYHCLSKIIVVCVSHCLLLGIKSSLKASGPHSFYITAAPESLSWATE